MLNVDLGGSTAGTTKESASLDALSDAAGQVASAGGSDIEDIDELFDGVDWATANFSQLEAQWRSELAIIEKDNVSALIESGEKGQRALPALNAAIQEIGRVEELFVEYNRQLKMMGQEISQIAEINQALDVQARNQRALQQELNRILGHLDVPEETLLVLAKPNYSMGSLKGLEVAARALYAVLHTKFERGIKDIRSVAERLEAFNQVIRAFEDGLLVHLVSLLRNPPIGPAGKHREHMKPVRINSVNDALRPYSGLIQLLAQRSPQKFADFRTAYESLGKGIVTTEMNELVEHFKAYNLHGKTPDEKPSFLLSANRPTSGINLEQFHNGRSFAEFKASGTQVLPELHQGDKLLPEQLLDYVLLMIVEFTDHLAQTVHEIFYPSASAEDHNGADKTVGGILVNMPALIEEGVAESLLRNDRLAAFPFLLVVERRLPELSEIPAMQTSFLAVQEKCIKSIGEFVKAQAEAIQDSRYSAKKRSGVFPFVSIFPKFVAVLERSITGCTATSSKPRTLANTAYEQISGAIFGNFSALIIEASQTDDDKDNLNANIMTIQNTYALQTRLKALNCPAIEQILGRCKGEFSRNLANYATLSMPRILGRLPDFFDGIAKLLQSTAPEEIAFHSAYDKAAARKMMTSCSPKDIRKAIEAIRDRVLKHFKGGPEADALIPLIWTALCESVLGRLRDFSQILSQVYPATDITLPLSNEEVRSFFKENTPR